MTTPKVILTTVVTTLTVLLFGTVVAVSLWPTGAEAHGFRSVGFGPDGHGGNRGNRHERFLKHCKRLSPAHTRVVEAMITAGLDLDASQQTALEPIMVVVDDMRTEMATVCAQTPPTDVDGHLALAEQMLQSGADAIARLRPAYESFYGQLNNEQKLRIDEMLQRHRPQSHSG